MKVFIPSMGRTGNLLKTVPAWLNHFKPADIIYVVAQEERDDYDEVMAVHGYTVGLATLPSSIVGIGAIRKWCVEVASDWGEKLMVMSDDDIYPHHSATFNGLALGRHVLGAGCATSYHDLLMETPERKAYLHDSNGSPIFARGGYAFRMFTLNVRNVVEVGNFDEALHTCFEDAELMRNGLANQLLWYIDPLVRGVSIGKRFEPGGIDAMVGGDPEVRKQLTDECYQYCYEKWPQFMSPPPLHRMSWQKMLNRYVKDWRKL